MQCSLVETAFLLLVTVSTVNLLTTVLNDAPGGQTSFILHNAKQFIHFPPPPCSAARRGGRRRRAADADGQPPVRPLRHVHDLVST